MFSVEIILINLFRKVFCVPTVFSFHNKCINNTVHIYYSVIIKNNYELWRHNINALSKLEAMRYNYIFE